MTDETKTCVLIFGGIDCATVEFEMPETPLDAARLIASLLDKYSGNYLGYPSILTKEEHARLWDIDGDDDAEARHD
jgi:hypothetical protein